MPALWADAARSTQSRITPRAIGRRPGYQSSEVVDGMDEARIRLGSGPDKDSKGPLARPRLWYGTIPLKQNAVSMPTPACHADVSG